MKAEKSEHGLDKLAKTRVKVFFFSTSVTVFMVAAFGGLGYYLDMQFGTSPKLLIAGLVLAYPITIVYLVKKLKKH